MDVHVANQWQEAWQADKGDGPRAALVVTVMFLPCAALAYRRRSVPHYLPHKITTTALGLALGIILNISPDPGTDFDTMPQSTRLRPRFALGWREN